MRRLFVSVMLVALLVALLPAAAFAGTVTAKLIAGKTEWVGLVEVSNDADNLYVRFVTYYGQDGYCLNETHLHVATDLALIPQNNGNPTPGQFDYKDDDLGCVHDIVYTVPLGDWTPGTSLFIAAHAVVGNWIDPYWEETGWGVLCGKIDVYGFPGNNWATYIPYTVQ